MRGTLYIVATPIGNLGDITFRSVETLKNADLILAEDTRVTGKLLQRFEIKNPLRRYDEYASAALYREIKKRLEDGDKVALVTDAGTPGMSDPGGKLVAFVRENVPDVDIVPVPGPSALATALSVSGISTGGFTFLGYPPQKKGRQKFFHELTGVKARPVILYESPHRFLKALDSLIRDFGADFKIFVGREMTKIHEDIFWGSVAEAKLHFQGERLRGEFVLIIP